ncbi:MAG: putative toxin-antitoxin system toxin component, PIN family [Candidatus Omnitrophica bacterium]|nr:putative toxin-antitoxin system toxin component, PIN family [Candidatus Omnitrophota bacterium]MBI5023424.1 putative toxin-antitoxin system toxin component, PIN family [Candidatus Omnitrophota bacterium]
MPAPKVVVDTNVFVSGVLWKGNSSILWESWKAGKFTLLFSPAIFDEYFEVIARPRFNQQESDIRHLAEVLTERAAAVVPRIKIDVCKEDPDDNKFIECAVAGGADFIVSGDQHLLRLREYQGIKIVTVAEFLQLSTS